MTQKTYKLVRQVILGNTTSDKIGSWQIEKQSTNDLLLREKPKKKMGKKEKPHVFCPQLLWSSKRGGYGLYDPHAKVTGSCCYCKLPEIHI
jgi:hypothetical protein